MNRQQSEDDWLPVTQRAIIPAAGLGTRQWPVTRAVPKAMFPVGNYPAIHWVIAEAIAGGCTEIAVVVSPRKPIIKEYLTHHGHTFHQGCRLTFIDQPEPLGLGHALLLAREFCDKEPAAVLLPDELMTCETPPLVQMNRPFRSQGGIVFALVKGSPENRRWSERWHLQRVSRRSYALQPRNEGSSLERGETRFVGVGRYLIAPECLEEAAGLLSPNRTREGELDDGMMFELLCAKGQPVHGFLLDARRFDISTCEGYLEAWRVLGGSKPEDIFPPRLGSLI